jgi:hypothetical protein
MKSINSSFTTGDWGSLRSSTIDHAGLRVVSAPCCITTTTFKATLNETVRGGQRVTTATFKVGMRVRRSSR